MNTYDKTRELMSEELRDSYTFQTLNQNGRLTDDELKVRRMDHNYHYEVKFKLLWNTISWHEQIQLAVRFPTNQHYKSFLDSVQFTAYKLLL